MTEDEHSSLLTYIHKYTNGDRVNKTINLSLKIPSKKYLPKIMNIVPSDKVIKNPRKYSQFI